MLKDYLAKECSLKTLSYRQNESLAPHSTFGIGGQCDYFVTPFSEESLSSLIRFLQDNYIRYKIIGNGSNLLFDDDGYRGCLISTKELKSLTQTENTLTVGAGYSLIALSSLVAKASLSGLEFATSIPATLGGAIYMNAGAYGGEIKDIVVSCRCLTPNGTIVTFTEHGFSYRHSVYQTNGMIILSATLCLKDREKDLIFADMESNRRKREASQPTKEKSAGSVFRREEGVIPAKLIDECRLKGFSIGDAAVSEKHAGFIVNHGRATSRDVLALIEHIQSLIFQTYHIRLSCEIQYIPAE